MEFRVLLMPTIDDMEAEGADAIAVDGPEGLGEPIPLPFYFQTAERQQGAFVLWHIVDQQASVGRIELDHGVHVVALVAGRMVLARNLRVIDAPFDEFIRRSGRRPGLRRVPLR